MQRVWDNWAGTKEPDGLTESFEIIGLFPVETANLDKYTGPGSVPAFVMAINAINANQTILKDYKITQGTANSACERDTVMHEFVTYLQEASKNGNLNKIVSISPIFVFTWRILDLSSLKINFF